MVMPSKHISITITRPVDDVYRFTSNPLNLPQWASGLSGSITNVDGQWVATSPMGPITIEFVEENQLGVLDHFVTLPSGKVFYNPFRAIPNNEGSEVVFTLYRQPEMSDEEFEADAGVIAADLTTLKALLER